MTQTAANTSATLTTAQSVRLAKDSLKRCLRQDKFLDRFYELFLASSDEIKAKFVGTQFVQQKIMLKASLHIMLMLAQGDLKDTQVLQDLSEKHSSRHLNIRPEFYQFWVNSMLQAVKESDPAYSDDIGTAWQNSLEPGVKFMLSKF